MLSRRQRPASPEVVARIRALLTASASSGWVPEDDEHGESADFQAPGRSVPAEAGDVSAASPAAVAGAGTRPVADAPRTVPPPGDRHVDAAPARRGVRLDPGRRAAVGLALLAVVAAATTGAFVLRGRPQEVPVPEVVRTGAALPGGSVGAGPAVPAVAGGAGSGVAGGAGSGVTPSGAAGQAAGRGALASGAAGSSPGEVVVAVAGKVRRPGLVRLSLGSRVDDAVRAAGGLAPGASIGMLNLARRLVDGEQVLVGVGLTAGQGVPGVGAGGAALGGPAGAPRLGAAGASGGGAAGASGALDLNAASAADFDDLPGIGPVLAERMVAWRTEHGRFASVDQLREVSGIGEAKFGQLRSRVGV